MRTPARQIALCSLIAATILASCSGERQSQRLAISKGGAREFSQQDKVVAQALSLGNDSTVEGAEGPYAEALLCSGAMDALVGHLSESGGASNEVVEALRQAQDLYDRRLRSLASSEGKSQNDLRRDLQRAASEDVALSANARVALGCIKKLQQTA